MESGPPPPPPPPPLGYQTTVFRAQPTEGAQRKIQKRNRPPVSCLLCRTRKVKCDRQQPCERCIKSGEANFCEYAPRAARKPRGSEPRTQPEVRSKPEAVSRPVLQTRLQKLEEMVNGLVTSGAFAEQTLNTPSSSDPRNETDTRSDLSSPPSLSTPSISTHGSTRTGEGNYVGNTHWASILESIHDIQGILDSELDAHPTPSPPPSNHNWSADCQDLIFGKGEMLTHEQAVARLPPQHQTDHLVLLYFRHRFTAAPYIHTNKFQKEYDSFWRAPTSVSLLWISCLASILWIATSIAIEKGETGLSDAPRPEQLSALAVDCLVSGDYLSAKPYSIEALLLHGYTEMREKHLVDSSLWAKFGLTARLAQRMGYHRDPKYLSNVTPFEGEIRRRAWFFIEVFDILFSIQQGVPPIIRDDECDTEAPANLYDADFDENMMVLPPSRPVSEPTSTLYLSIKSKLCRILRRILRLTLSIHQPAYEDVLKLNDELHHYHSQIPPALQIKPIRSYSFTDQTYDIMHRLMLEMMFLKSLCFLHRPYLNREKDNPQCDLSRNICREAALRILDIHAEYEEETKPGGRMYEDKYMLSSLTVHDFLIASMIICLDLTENLPSTPAERSRKLKALGTSYKIWSERKNTSKEAAHATRIVGAILRRVSMQDTLQPKPPPPPPQTDVRDGSLAILLNNDVQLPPLPVSYDQSQLIPAMGFSLDFMDPAPIDNVLKDSNMADWTLIDHILLDRPESTYRPTAL
ncbi:fungal-specific transcription factor domain-containing protein [Xylaria sp. FL0064]|nr:fungal-specific transcription factor domain-containing protein [Xylaria sp. FL0064]